MTSLNNFDINGASFLVTGATGSFGRQFVRTLLAHHNPRRLVVFSRDELKQFEMAQEFPTADYPQMRYFIGDVRDADRLQMAMRDIDVVIHAAALKQVTTAEYNPFECVHTNVLGAENVVRASLRSPSVKRVLALSTDKAANPINLYGASKLASDKIFVAANNLAAGKGPSFAVVRYGNVMGSRGSIVPVFRRLIAEGAKALPITDPRMTRFWITLPQGIEFVLSSVRMMQGGELFVPKIPSARMTDLAKAMAPDLPIKIVGIRPGEKLHEAMITTDDSRNTLELADRYIIRPNTDAWSDKQYIDAGATQVAEGFSYHSDTNGEWLGVDDLTNLLTQFP